MQKVLVVGQTPPPYHGQAIMIDRLVKYNFDKVELYFVRMAFSENLEEVGKFQFGKILHLLKLIVEILKVRIKYNINVLYYPPSGPVKISIYRDIIILNLVRPFFKKVIFHFHAGGVSESYEELPSILKPLFRGAYYKSDASILISDFNPQDGTNMYSKEQVVIPYGVTDEASMLNGKVVKLKDNTIRILFVGAVRETKGVTTLIETADLLRQRGVSGFEFHIVGPFFTDEYEREAKGKVTHLGLQKEVLFRGLLVGEEKQAAYKQADIFCFPTFYEAETFGIVLLEAMQFNLPVVASRWRGIPSIVTDGEDGFLVPVQDPASVADKLEVLMNSPELREAMGRKGRLRFESNFTLDVFMNKMQDLFIQVGTKKCIT
ncbi:MAG: glycosyltransferase family 4 protein [Bacteroidota bacterium]